MPPVLRRPVPLLPAALLAAVALASGACASGGEESGGMQTGAGTQTEIPLARAEEKPQGPPTVHSLPPETRAFMEEGLRQFARNDEKWETTRAQWVARGGRETEILVETMWAALLRMQRAGQPADVERARHELALIGMPSVPLLAGVISAGQIGSVVDPQTGDQVPILMDDLQRQEASAALVIIGTPAVPAVLGAYESAETKAGRIWAVKTLGNMGDRGGAAAAEALVRVAQDPDFVLRVEAVSSMQYRSDAPTREALLRALEDPEELVRTKAAESLARRGETGAAPAIRAAAEAAHSAGRIGEAKRLEHSAVSLEQRGK